MNNPGAIRTPGWRWIAALLLFLFAFGGLLSGVSLSLRPEVTESGPLTMAYYSLGLFVVGGLDLGTPVDGPLLGRTMLWLAYFGAPILTASAVIEALVRVMSPHRWRIKRLSGHVVVVGSDELCISYLRVLRKHSPTVAVVVVDNAIELVRRQELVQGFGAVVITGEITHDFLLQQLRLDRASHVALFGADNFQGYEAAGRMLTQFPQLRSRIVLHCSNLRFLRAMQNTYVAQQCVTFNSYHLAATGLVRDHVRRHILKTRGRDVIVIAGYGRFGQTILEELQLHAAAEIDTVALIDVDADRRVLVADEQRAGDTGYRREVFQGDISHPEVWRKLSTVIDLERGEPVLILGTGRTEDNLRTALWLKHKYPNALVFARTDQVSEFARRVASEHGIYSTSITELVEDNIPREWVA